MSFKFEDLGMSPSTDKHLYCVSVDLSRQIGILNFTHELTIWFYEEDDSLEFINADEITPGGWETYSTQYELEEVYPTIFNEIEKAFNKE